MGAVLSFGRKSRGDAPEAGKPRSAFVVVLAGDRMGETFPLTPGQTAIGRGIQSGVRINDDGISRVHAYVDSDGTKYVLRDAGSTNGTFANGDRVESHVLREGDKIQILIADGERGLASEEVAQFLDRAFIQLKTTAWVRTLRWLKDTMSCCRDCWCGSSPSSPGKTSPCRALPS